jgi:hypothetical protein
MFRSHYLSFYFLIGTQTLAYLAPINYELSIASLLKVLTFQLKILYGVNLELIEIITQEFDYIGGTGKQQSRVGAAGVSVRVYPGILIRLFFLQF